MKKIYFLGLSVLTSMLMAQETISFEASEGYTSGTLHGQNGWEVTEGSDGILVNQVITDEMANDGVYSFKNAHEPDFDFQWLPIFGAAKSFDAPLAFDGFSISYDILVTQRMGADFEFTAFGINDIEEFNPVAGIGIENRGEVYIIKNTDYEFEYIEGVSWEPNTWYNVKIEISADEIKYYLDGELIYTGDNFSQLNVSGFNMLHNNYGGSAYYDNIKVNGGSMATTDLNKGQISIYPNPVKDIAHFKLDSNQDVKAVEVFSVSGHKLITANDAESLNVSRLPKGVYIIKVTSASGKTFTEKFIKQ